MKLENFKLDRNKMDSENFCEKCDKPPYCHPETCNCNCHPY